MTLLRFKKGMRVQLSAQGRQAFPRSAGKQGAVASDQKKPREVSVLWDGNKTTYVYDTDFIERASFQESKP